MSNSGISLMRTLDRSTTKDSNTSGTSSRAACSNPQRKDSSERSMTSQR
ncbi:hypothetical protein NSERUTF1_1611 [Nocardia seriolae]|nr:hypothetical protein NSERUTF1_1611 [Nocardia seriolae]